MARWGKRFPGAMAVLAAPELGYLGVAAALSRIPLNGHLRNANRGDVTYLGYRQGNRI